MARFGAGLLPLREKLSDLWGTGQRFGRLGAWLAKVERDLIRHSWRHAGATAEEKEAALAEHYEHWASSLVSILQDNGGTWVKVGQFLSCRPDMMAPTFISHLANLQSHAKPVPFAQVYPVLTSHWGRGWERLFNHFDVVPQHTASIAQVYRAELASGHCVAVKVVVPGVAARFEHDARVLKLFAHGLNQVVSGFDWVAVIDQFISMTRDEFNLTHELSNIERMQSYYGAEVCVPGVFAQYSGNDVLVMSWVAGESLHTFLSRAASGMPEAPDPVPVLSAMARLYMHQISAIGLFHADPHPGNILVMPNGQIGLIDFGAVGELSVVQRKALNGLLAMIFGFAPTDFSSQLALAGFRGIDPVVMERIQAVVAQTRDAHDFSGVLTVLLDEFRRSRVEMPGAFVAVVRVLVTVSGYLSKFNVDFDYLKLVLKH